MTEKDLRQIWVRDLPPEWHLIRASLAVKGVERPPLDGDEVITCFRDGEVTLRSNRRTDGYTVAFKEFGYQHIDPGDLVIHSMDGGWGAIGVSDSSGKASPVVHAYRSAENDLGFIAYVLRAMAFSGFLIAQSKGIRERSTQFDRRTFANLYLPLPPLEEQRRIVDYLDDEVRETDVLIVELQRLVADLSSRRAKLVEEACGQAKESKARVGLVAKCVRRGISPSYCEETGLRVINQKCVRPQGDVDFGWSRLHDDGSVPVSEVMLLRTGDILINSTGTGTLGRVAFVGEKLLEPTTFDSHVTLVRPDEKKVKPSYLAWMIHAQEKRLIDLSVGSTNQIELSRQTVMRLEFPLPSLERQCEIADELDRETAEMDFLIKEATELIENLKARKTALITEVVKGRKKA